MDKTQGDSRPLALLAALAAIGMIVGSWAPFNLQFSSLDEAWSLFLNSQSDRTSRSDVTANFLLGMPVAYALMGTLRSTIRSPNACFACVLLSLLVTAIVSFICEFGQAWMGDRVPSVRDCYAQFLGAITAIVAWGGTGSRFLRLLDGLLHGKAIRSRFDSLLSLVVAGVVIWQLLPFDFVTSPVEIARKWTDGRIRLNIFSLGGERLPEFSFQSLTSLVLAVPVGWWAVVRLTRRWSLAISLSNQCLLSLLVGLGLETLQLFVQSRITSATDAVFATIGAFSGIQIARSVNKHTTGAQSQGLPAPFRRDGVLRDPTFWWLAAFFYLLVLCLISWYPFDFMRKSDDLRIAFRQLADSPFADYRGSNLKLAFRIIRTLILSSILGMLLGIGVALGRNKTLRWLTIAVTLIGIVGSSFLVELGQLIEVNHVGAGIGFTSRLAGSLLGYYLAFKLMGWRWRQS
ncbi:MAG: VanZ family protein [Planctomycetales bacterium]|nr:VanZ family protein [Planctomycetales bacterium]